MIVFFVLVQLLIIYAFIQNEIVIVLGVILGSAFFLLSVFSVERSFYLMAFYYLAFPEIGYNYNFPDWKIFFTWYLGLPLFFWLLGNWFLYLFHNKIHNKQLANESNLALPRSLRTMDKLLLIFIGTFTFSAILGFLRGFNRTYWTYDYLGLLMYLGYFVYLYSPLSKNHRRLFGFAVFCSIIVSAQYIQSLMHFGGAVVLRRITSTHIHIALLTLPYFGAIILYASSKFRRILALILFPVVLVGVIIYMK